MSIRLELVARAFFNQVWAVTPEMYSVLENIVLERLDGHKPDASEIEARVDGKTYGSGSGAVTGGAIVQINLHGVLMSRVQAMERLSGGNTPQRFASAIRQAADDPTVGTIVISVDSPGGSVAGIGVAAAAVAYAAGKKRTIAVIDDAAYSAAYWIVSGASEIVIPESGGVGSISVIMAHLDRREQLANIGIKPTVLRTGANKALGQEIEALTPTIRAKLEANMQKWHDLFVADVARGRGRTAAEVQAQWADGSTWLGQAAVDAGLADRVGDLHTVLAELNEPPEDAPPDEQGDGGGDEENVVPIAVKEPPPPAAGPPAAGPPTPPSPDAQAPPTGGDPSPTAPPPDANPAHPDTEDPMKIADLTAKLAAGQPLTPEERAFLNQHLDAQGAAPPVVPAANMSSWPAEARAAFEQMQGQLTTMGAQLATAQAETKQERDIRLDREFREKAVALGQPVEFGATLRTLHEANPEAAAQVEERLKATAKASALTSEIGVTTRPGAADPQARIQARAKELEAKGMAADQALTTAMQEEASASTEYSQEVRK